MRASASIQLTSGDGRQYIICKRLPSLCVSRSILFCWRVQADAWERCKWHWFSVQYNYVSGKSLRSEEIVSTSRWFQRILMRSIRTNSLMNMVEMTMLLESKWLRFQSCFNILQIRRSWEWDGHNQSHRGPFCEWLKHLNLRPTNWLAWSGSSNPVRTSHYWPMFGCEGTCRE